jgi:hypothetical protein
MNIPTIGPFGTDIYAELEPLTKQDSLYGWSLLYYLGAIGTMFDEIETYARDGPNGEAGWSIILDVTRAPYKALPWLGQFVGVYVPDTLSDAVARARIVSHPNFQRGTLAAIIAAAQTNLTGVKGVLVTERYQGDAYSLYVATRAAQTPSPTQTQKDILAAKPAGLSLTFETLAGQTFQELLSKTPTLQSTYTTYATFQGVLKDAAGT